ncbi:MAG: DNA topoisomerase I, partial [Candidatus Aenigmarchaeota archaeon]|nr:DNA topoisomerase I [Candidatus Aenigmarchaeota archaeon]
ALVRGASFINTRGKLKSKEEAKAALQNSSKEGAVSGVKVRQFKQHPPAPFDLTSLQVEAYRWFKFAPALTLRLAQSLYENSFISYPRTASQKLPSKLNHPKLLSIVGRNERYGALVDRLVSADRTKPHEGKKDDPAHPAIHPISGQQPAEQREAKLFDLIVRRYLACFAEWAKRESGRIELQLGSEKYEAKGTRTIERNWMDYYGPYAKFEEIALPPLAEGENVKAEKLNMREKKTKPPSRYTEASIVQELESRNIGTKATRSAIIETLYKRGYVKGKSILVTPLGLAVFDSLSKNCPQILDEELTRNLEAEMEFIRTGELAEEKVLEHGKEILTGILGEFK